MEEIIVAILFIAMLIGIVKLIEAGVFIADSLKNKEDREFGFGCLLAVFFAVCMVAALIS